MTTEWKNAVVSEMASIIDAISIIDKAGLRVALVVAKSDVLLGIVTDVEVRRAILNNQSLEDSVLTVMNKNPYTVSSNYMASEVVSEMKQHGYSHLPVIDENGKLQDLILFDELLKPSKRDNEVVLMAGGLGSRLRPLTNDCPKPLLKVGGKPILENILRNFVDAGFYNFHISLNYRGEMIKEYFGDGERFNANIRYIEEKERLGTAGALSLMETKTNKPIFVMNGDLLTTVDFNHLLDYHSHHKTEATMCVREYDIAVPYGVVTTESENIISITEKPVQRFFVNAGIYVLEPQLLKMIPPDKYYDITTLFQDMLEKKRSISSFPLREHWMDIGQLDDFVSAERQFSEKFQ